MTALEAWCYRDPAEVLDRKRAIERSRADRSRAGRQQKAREGLEALFGGTMTIDESEQIESLLAIWYEYERGYMPRLDAPSVSPSCRGYSSGDVHMDAEDKDDMLERIKAQAVAACLDDIHYMHRAAIGLHMRNRTAKAAVYRNPRIRIEDQHAKYQEAKAALLPGLRRRELIKY